MKNAVKTRNLAKKVREDGRPVGTPFEPGNLGGPGRPKGLAAYIRERTNNGQDGIDELLRIAHGEPSKDKRGRYKVAPKDSVRIEAWKIILDRGFGRVPLAEEAEGLGQITLIVTREDYEDMRQLGAFKSQGGALAIPKPGEAPKNRP